MLSQDNLRITVKVTMGDYEWGNLQSPNWDVGENARALTRYYADCPRGLIPTAEFYPHGSGDVCWSVQEHCGYQRFLKSFGVADREEHPLLACFVDNEGRLPFIKHIADILAWHNILFSVFGARTTNRFKPANTSSVDPPGLEPTSRGGSVGDTEDHESLSLDRYSVGPISRDEASELTNWDVVEMIPKGAAREEAIKTLQAYCIAFNDAFPLVRNLFECQANPFVRTERRIIGHTKQSPQRPALVSATTADGIDDDAIDNEEQEPRRLQHPEQDQVTEEETTIVDLGGGATMGPDTAVAFSLPSAVPLAGGGIDAPGLCTIQLIRTLSNSHNDLLDQLRLVPIGGCKQCSNFGKI
jgi:hypothetical protein